MTDKAQQLYKIRTLFTFSLKKLIKILGCCIYMYILCLLSLSNRDMRRNFRATLNNVLRKILNYLLNYSLEFLKKEWPLAISLSTFVRNRFSYPACQLPRRRRHSQHIERDRARGREGKRQGREARSLLTISNPGWPGYFHENDGPVRIVSMSGIDRTFSFATIVATRDYRDLGISGIL